MVLPDENAACSNVGGVFCLQASTKRRASCAGMRLALVLA